jgi:ATP adenylyltransferase
VKTIWAPWRMQYILSPKGPGCLFCTLPGEGSDRENLILYRRGQTYVIMNRYPYNNGHLMVVPYFHTSSFEGLSSEVLGEMMEVSSYSVDCLSRAFRPEGFNVGINIGKVAGAGIEEHLHIHIVPRWAGDASFMTIAGEVRVIPEHIMDTFDKLHPVFNSGA